MTANNILSILHNIVNNSSCGDIPIKHNGKDVEFLFTLEKGRSGEYYINLSDKSNFKGKVSYKIIRHKNPQGRTTWYRAVYYDEQGVAHKSPCYGKNMTSARRAAQNWLYANIHIWCTIAYVEQRTHTENGQPHIIQLGTEEII